MEREKKVIDTKYRKKYQSLLIDPLLKLKWIQKLHPKWLTLTSLLFGLAICIFLPLGHPYAALLCLALSGFFDTLDGSLARHLNCISDQGAVLDITADRIVEFSIILALFFVAPLERGLYCLLCMGSILFCITTFLVVGIFSKNESNRSFQYSFGIIERAEAFIFFGAMLLFPSAFVYLAILFSILVFLTGGVRIYEFFQKDLARERL